jgi:hypothetical protein
LIEIEITLIKKDFFKMNDIEIIIEANRIEDGKIVGNKRIKLISKYCAELQLEEGVKITGREITNSMIINGYVLDSISRI